MKTGTSINALWAGLIGHKYSPALILLIALLILGVDYLTGSKIQFPILFVIPVAWAAWGRRTWLAYGLAFVLPCIRFVFYFLWHEADTLHIGIINAIIRMIALMLGVFFMGQMRHTLELKQQIHLLWSILPICASCRKIRNEKGEYIVMDPLLRGAAEAHAGHGLCPDCAKKLPPDNP